MGTDESVGSFFGKVLKTLRRNEEGKRVYFGGMRCIKMLAIKWILILVVLFYVDGRSGGEA